MRSSHLDNPAPTTIEAVLDKSWLAAALAGSASDCKLSDVSVVEEITTVATKLRLALNWEGGSGDLPDAVCIKGILKNASALQAMQGEVKFYREIAPHLPLATAPCVYGGLDAQTGHGVLIMRDLKVSGWEFLTPLSPVQPELVEQTLRELAQFHVSCRAGSRFDDQTWVPHFLAQIVKSPIMPVDKLHMLLNGDRGVPLKAESRDGARLQRALGALSTFVDASPSCFVHGDAHAGNICRNSNGPMLIDWQIVQRGHWSQDVAYHIAAILTPEQRRAHEARLLGGYLDAVAEFGGERPHADEAMLWYRRSLAYGFYLWAITQKVDPAVTLEFVRRLGIAVQDHDSFAALGV